MKVERNGRRDLLEGSHQAVIFHCIFPTAAGRFIWGETLINLIVPLPSAPIMKTPLSGLTEVMEVTMSSPERRIPEIPWGGTSFS